MKGNFKLFTLIWVLVLVLFNAVIFLVRPVIPGYVITYDVRFWIAWALIIVAFIVNLVLANLAFKAENLKKMFYNLPLITVSWTALIVMFVVGSALMLVPDCPAWIATIVCIVILVFDVIAVIKAVWAADTVGNIDDKVKTQTMFVKRLTLKAEELVGRAKSDAIKTECNKVYEAMRYSDPVSTGSLSVVEAKITEKMNELSAAVDADDTERAKEISGELLALANERNKACKTMK